MKTKCPSCGAEADLDLLLGANAAAKSFRAALNVPPELTVHVVRYLGLFRSTSGSLTHEKAARLLNQLTPHINKGELTFDKTTTPAPIKAWAWAIDQMMSNQANISTPLTNHHYLYRVVQGYDARKHDAEVSLSDLRPSTGASSGVVPDELAQQLKQDRAERKAQTKDAVPMPADAAQALKSFTRNTKNF